MYMCDIFGQQTTKEGDPKTESKMNKANTFPNF